MKPWEELARTRAPDGLELVLRRRGDECLVCVAGRDLMSSRDAGSSRALAVLGCEGLQKKARVLVGGLGLGSTLGAALELLSADSIVEVAELVPGVVEWSRKYVGHLAGHPLDDARTVVRIEDVAVVLRRARSVYDAVLLDVDNGPDHLAHEGNAALYEPEGLRMIQRALRPGGVLALWSFSDDAAFTRRLAAVGMQAKVHRVDGDRSSGRGRHHWIWVARAPGGRAR
jgi:spermidine synthase